MAVPRSEPPALPIGRAAWIQRILDLDGAVPTTGIAGIQGRSRVRTSAVLVDPVPQMLGKS